MKWLFALVLAGALAWAYFFVPPRSAAKWAAHGLRLGWDWVASIGPSTRPPAKTGQKPSRKAQAAAPQHHPGRDGIVPQPPKETLHPNDRAALDSLVANGQQR